MTIPTVLGADATGANVGSLPKSLGAYAGYVTGSGGVPWTLAQLGMFPGLVRIDQSPVNTEADETADVLDYESGAATLADIAPWCRAALAAFHAGVRPGQRMPAVYASASNTTQVVNALIAGGITSGIGLGVAHYEVTQADATAAVANAGGPFPVVWFQFSNQPAYDLGVFSLPWLQTVSLPRPPAPPGQWLDPRAWTWRQAQISGVGMDGQLHSMVLTGSGWQKLT